MMRYSFQCTKLRLCADTKLLSHTFTGKGKLHFVANLLTYEDDDLSNANVLQNFVIPDTQYAF